MTIVLATPMATERRAVLAGLGAADPGPGHPVVDMRHAGRDLVLAVTGVGPVSSAAFLGRLLGSRPDVSGVVNLGIAGSFDLHAAPVGAATVVDLEIFPEYGVVDTGLPDPDGVGLPQLERGAVRVVDRIALDPEGAARAMGLALPPGLARGPSLSVAGASGTPRRAALLKERHQALTENMEGFSMALACLDAGLPFLELRTVSNGVGHWDPDHWDTGAAFNALGSLAAALLAPRPPCQAP